MRRSIDDFPQGEGEGLDDDVARVAVAVGISDDYPDANPRVVLTVEEVGGPGAGIVAHLTPDHTRRLRTALRAALREIGEIDD
ncbi:MAG: hypothetical protein ACOYNI_00965 [Acidimicrobiia bacterium]